MTLHSGKMSLTKNDMARVVVQALYNLPTLPAADDLRVVRIAARTLLPRLAEQHQRAVDLLLDKVASEERDRWLCTINQ